MDQRRAYEEFAVVSGWAQRELTFAARDAGVAARFERSAVQGPPARREERARIAALHRGNQRRHLAAARLFAAHSRQLCRPAGRPGSSPAEVFVAAVADACGTGSVVVALAGSGQGGAVVAASDAVAGAARDLEDIYGEGPGRDAAAGGGPVRAAGGALAGRWPLYAAAVSGLGVQAVAAAALRAFDRSLGTLTAFYPRPPASAGAGGVGRLADALSWLLLAGNTAAGRDGLPPVPLLGEGGGHLVIHQAAGMVAATLGVDIPAALDLIRARAFAESQPAQAIAAQIVRRDLHLAALE